MTTWVSAEWLQHLGRAPAGMEWARLALLAALSIIEWVLGFGWVMGQALWFFHQHPLNRPGK